MSEQPKEESVKRRDDEAELTDEKLDDVAGGGIIIEDRPAPVLSQSKLSVDDLSDSIGEHKVNIGLKR